MTDLQALAARLAAIRGEILQVEQALSAVPDDAEPVVGGVLKYTGVISRAGNRLSNGTATGILVGCNMSGMEDSAIGGFADWSFDGGVPNWAAYATWKPNSVRIPLNAASFLGLTCGITASQPITFKSIPGATSGALTAPWLLPTGLYPIAFNGNDRPYALGSFTKGFTTVSWPTLTHVAPSVNAVAAYWGGVTVAADPKGTYRSSVKAAIDAARAIGCYVILDLHWCRPKLTLGGVTRPLLAKGQPAFADADTAIAFWQALVGWLRATYGDAGYADLVFELFNEPYLNMGPGALTTTRGGTAPVSADAALLIGGFGSAVVNESQGGMNWALAHPWRLAGYQEVLDAIRNAGATNLCIVNGNTWAQELATALTWKPKDALGQVAFGWHPYPHGTYPYADGDVYPKTGNDAGNGTLAAVQWAEKLLAAGECVLCTEDGGFGGASATAGEHHLTYMNAWAAERGVSRILWQWNSPRVHGIAGCDNYLTVLDVDGKTVLPLQGCGQVTFDFFRARAV